MSIQAKRAQFLVVWKDAEALHLSQFGVVDLASGRIVGGRHMHVLRDFGSGTIFERLLVSSRKQALRAIGILCAPRVSLRLTRRKRASSATGAPTQVG